jgi:plasmid stability protein
MSALIIPDVEENVLTWLRERATANGRAPEVEAKRILTEALQVAPGNVWMKQGQFIL